MPGATWLGYSDFDVATTSGLKFSTFNSHAVYWSSNDIAPELLTNFPPSAAAPYGFADAYGINDSNQIVGASILANGQLAGVIWQWNKNTNGVTTNGDGSITTGAPFWEITDLNHRLTDSSWQVFRAVDINNAGLILAHASINGTKHAVLLIPIAMAVDNNRDGNITFDDADQTTADKPYRFWINNDHDGYDKSISDYADLPLTPSTGNDADNTSISCTRDLEDYTRLWINAQDLTDYLHNGNLQLALEWKSIASGNPAIRILPAVESNGGTLYLTDEATALAQSNAPYGSCIVDSFVGQTEVAGSLPFIIPTNLLANLSDTQPVLHLLFDAVGRGKGELAVAIYKSDGLTKIAEGPSVWLDLKDVKEMYQRWTVDNNGAVATTASVMNSPYPYDSTIPADNNFVLFVHGWNLAPWERDAFADTAFKRLYWQGYKGRFGAFEWPTLYGFGSWKTVITDPDNFDNSESIAWASAAGLLGKLTDLNAAYPGHVYLMAHSMGNVVAGEALKLAGASPVVNTYVAMQAAVASHAYDASATARPLMFLGINQDSGTPNRYAHYCLIVGKCDRRLRNRRSHSANHIQGHR